MKSSIEPFVGWSQDETVEDSTRLTMVLESLDIAHFTSRPGADFAPINVSENIVAMTGFGPDQFTANPRFWIERLYPDDRERIHRELAQLSAFGSRTLEYRWQVADGSYKWFSDFVRFVYRGESAEPYIIGRRQIITERKRIEEERRHLVDQQLQAQKLESLGVLASGIAHDFNNLLTGIMINAELALLEMPRHAPTRTYLEQVQKTSSRAANLCNQLLAYSGKGQFVVKAFNLSELVSDMGQLLEAAVSKAIVINYNLADDLPAMQGDVNQIRQVVMNLITNASEAIGDREGVITISTGLGKIDRDYLAETYIDESLPTGFYVYLEVGDTGSGMDAQTKARLFDPFFTTKCSGRGLGLSAVLGILRGHRGAVRVDSAPGRGTTMRLLFPCSDLPRESVVEPIGQSTTWRGSGLILVVDDEDTVRGAAKRILELHGLDIITAQDGADAIERFAQFHGQISAVLLDLSMPNLDGAETLERLRKIDPDVRVLLSSGYTEADALARFADTEVCGFIQKPYHHADLVEKLRRVLSSTKGC